MLIHKRRFPTYKFSRQAAATICVRPSGRSLVFPFPVAFSHALPSASDATLNLLPTKRRFPRRSSLNLRSTTSDSSAFLMHSLSGPPRQGVLCPPWTPWTPGLQLGPELEF